MAKYKYLLLNKDGRKRASFKTSEEVSSFMLGRSYNEWFIYQLQKFPEGARIDVRMLETTLDKRELAQNTI